MHTIWRQTKALGIRRANLEGCFSLAESHRANAVEKLTLCIKNLPEVLFIRKHWFVGWFVPGESNKYFS